MKDTLSALLVAWTAVHFFVAGSYAFLAHRHQRGPEYASFAVLSLGLAVYTIGGAGLLMAPDGFEAARAQSIQMMGIAVSLAAFMAFFSQLLDFDAKRWMNAVFAFATVSVMAIAAGLYFDPADPMGDAAPLFPFAPRTHEVALQPVGTAFLLVGLAIGTGFVLDMGRKARGNPDIRVLTIIATIGLPAYTIDTAARFLHRPSFYLFEHAAVFGSTLVSYVLMRRFVQAGDELERRTLELRRSYDELRHVQEELVRKEQLAAIGELSAVIAHEVRNPLAVLKNAVSGLRRKELAEQDRATLFTILDEETDRLNRLVRDLLSYAKPVDPQAVALPLERLLERSLDLAIRGNARSSSYDFELQLDDLPESAEGDRDLLERAFINIVENALQAMPNGGRLTISGQAASLGSRNAVALDFSDTGEGMDTLVRSRARDPFFTTRPSGTGLGLAIVERVIRAHGGTIELAKNVDAGSTVRVTLPLRRSR